MSLPVDLPFYFDVNKAVLSKMNKKLCAAFCEDPKIPETITLLRTKTGSLTIKYKDVLLHSVYNPEKEAERFVAAQSISAGTVVISYGLGLGYHISEILKKVGPSGKVFVLEPNLDILKTAFLLLDMRPFMDDPRCYILSGEDEESVALRFLSTINRELYNVSDEVKNILIHAPSFKCLPEGYHKLQNIFEMLLIDRRAPEIFEKINKTNIEKNLDAVITSPGFASLKGAYQKMPAFFINAGPSLDGVLPLVKKYHEKAVFFCSDTALQALIGAGICPDYILTVDPQEKSRDHFNGCFDCAARLIFTPTSAAGIIRDYTGEKVLLLQEGHSITRRFQDLLSAKGSTAAGSSVSCMGLDLLIQMKCDPIIFVGTDYSFPAGKMYSSHMSETKKWYGRCSRLYPLETIHYEAIRAEKIVTIQNKYGEDIPTYQNMLMYVRYIEALIEETPDVSFYTFRCCGADIKGTEDIVLTDELELLLSKKIDKARVLNKDPLDQELRKKILEQITTA
jgi:hypothetical protein